jgi:hypothetical protein
MTVDALGLLRIVHRVTGFLIGLSPAQLTGLAEGRISLGIADDASLDPVPQRSRQEVARDRSSRPAPARAPVPGGEAVDYAEIAAMLRKQDTEEDGLAYLQAIRPRGRKPIKSDLIAVAKELNLTLPASVTVADATRRLLNHAIGNRRKYEGLRP